MEQSQYSRIYGGKKEDIKKEQEVLEKVVEKPMGDDNIRQILPKANIILYPELKKYTSIDQILPKNKSYAIILYLNSPSSGHWTAIMRPNDNEIEYFDSYGHQIDHPLSWISNDENKKLGIDEPYLSKLLKESGKKIIWNKKKFQQLDGDIATCGRHCCNRIQCMKNRSMGLKRYCQMMDRVKQKTGLDFDDIVGTMISPESELNSL